MKSNITKIISILRAEYPHVKTQLHHANPFQLLIATILSAQCTDRQVNLVTVNLFKRLPTPDALAGARLATIEKIIYSTGFYRNKAKHIRNCARSLLENHNGEVPDTLEALTALPGVGRKTANVVLGTSFGVPGMVVDTHVARISKKLGLTKSKDPKKIEFDLMALMPEKEWNDFSLFLIYLGRGVCFARKPDCGSCKLTDYCIFLKSESKSKVMKKHKGRGATKNSSTNINQIIKQEDVLKVDPKELVGAHFSISKGLDKAVEEAASFGSRTLQVFSKNASTWKEKEISKSVADKFKQSIEKNRIVKVASHTSYLINPAVSEDEKKVKSENALINEFKRCHALGIEYIVQHPGSHMGAGESQGIKNAASMIRRVFENINDHDDFKGMKNIFLLLETTAGQGRGIGHTFEHIAEIIELSGHENRIGVCLDTCHIFAAGYDIRTEKEYTKTMTAFDRVVGISRLAMIHMNDSKKGLGERVDRHEHIGEGLIGPETFRLIMEDAQLSNIPKILETPKKKDGVEWDAKNIETLRAFLK